LYKEKKEKLCQLFLQQLLGKRSAIKIVQMLKSVQLPRRPLCKKRCEIQSSGQEKTVMVMVGLKQKF